MAEIPVPKASFEMLYVVVGISKQIQKKQKRKRDRERGRNPNSLTHLRQVCLIVQSYQGFKKKTKRKAADRID